MTDIKQELIELVQNDREVVYELVKALDIDMLEDEVNILREKIKREN